MSAVSVVTFIGRQVRQIRQGGRAVLVRKIKLVSPILLTLPLDILALPAVMAIRLIKPWFLVRIGCLVSSRIGHFAANTELYLCERDAAINRPMRRHVDLFFLGYKPICNRQLATMWKRILRFWPSWILAPVLRLNWLIPGGAVHEVGSNTKHDRDVHNLLERFPPYLHFTAEEEARGEAGLRDLGIPAGSPFVCLNVRDSAYLNSHFGQPGRWRYHNYRDCNIQNFVRAAEELAERGYFVIRMGAKVHKPMKSSHPRVIDYATNGMRSDFMDIYLGAKCTFCISTSAGWDAVPLIFRRPIVFVSFVPLGHLVSYVTGSITICKHHVLERQDRELTLSEIFTHGVGFTLFTSEYDSKHVQLIENTPEEIRDVTIEMAERLAGTWQEHEGDEALQMRFWEIFSSNAIDPYQGQALHGEIRARFGATFLRNNRAWLQ